MIKAAVVGGTGYTGVELMRLLARHPGVELALATSRSDAGKAVAEVYPNLKGAVDLVFREPDPARLAECEVIFFATPNGTAMRYAESLLAQGRVVIDLAADFRLRDPQLWEQWYGQPHACPHLLDQAVYGLPEFNRDRIREARLIACPGCYPTAVQLGLFPLMSKRLAHPAGLIADCKSGLSGAGRRAQLGSLMAEAGESFKAYAVSGHRHHPEICQGLEAMGGQPVDLTFVPHLVPMIRGIHATLYVTPREHSMDFQNLFESFYADEPFVDVLPAGSHPDTGDVRGANRCQIAIHQPSGRRLVVLSVIDNLVKGAAGQALQNMNLVFGFPEMAGLEMPALYP